jgi:hypothetical protein
MSRIAIPTLAEAPASAGRSGLKPLSQGAAVLEPQTTPRQSEHAGVDASVTSAGKAPLTPAFAALVWGAREAGVASDGLTVAELTREDLVDKHICRLNADADDPRDKMDHSVSAFLFIAISFELLQACSLNRSDLVTHHVETCEVTKQLCTGVFRQK